VEDETALGFDRPAGVDRHVRYGPWLDPELAQQAMKAQPGHDPANADAKRAFFIMLANRDHRPLKAGIANARHGKQ
jgi:hypothetical protein